MDISVFLFLAFLTVLNAQQMHHGAHGSHVMPAQQAGQPTGCEAGWEPYTHAEAGTGKLVTTCLWYSEIELNFWEAQVACAMMQSHVTAIFSGQMQRDLSTKTKMLKPGLFCNHGSASQFHWTGSRSGTSFLGNGTDRQRWRTGSHTLGLWLIGITNLESRNTYKLAYNREEVNWASLTWTPGMPNTASEQKRCVYLDNDKQLLVQDACSNRKRFICQGHY